MTTHHPDSPGVQLQKRTPGDVVPVLEAELVPDQPTRERQHLVGRLVQGRAVVVTVLGSSSTAVAAGRGGKRALRAVWMTGKGAQKAGHRAWDAATFGRYRRLIRLAEIAGDRAEAKELEKDLVAARTARSERLQDLPRVVLGVLAMTGLVLVLAAVALLLLGIGAAATAEPGLCPPPLPDGTGPACSPAGTAWAGWWAGVGAVLGAVTTAVRWLLEVAPVLAVPVLAVLAWREGVRHATAPGWLLAPSERAGELHVDERTVSIALAHLRIPAIDAYVKAGGVLEYPVPVHRDGAGVAGRVRVPMGTTAEEVAARRPRAAANLQRATLEVWLTVGDQAGLLDFWIADPGQLSASAGDWPLLHEGEGDVFAGVPIGRAQRGTVIETPLFESNWLIGGRPGQGKSAAMRTLLLGAALDPTCELWCFVMGESPDFAPFGPRLSRYAMGMDDEVAEAALAALRDALAEMERRGKVLGELPGSPPKTSRRLANRLDLGLHPLVLSIDECHELFMHPKHGKEAADLAIRLIKRGRKYGVILVLATQSPTKDSIPREVTRNVSTGVAFAVADHVANDGLLGAGKYKAGVRATDLRMRTDRGTAVAVGVTDEVFELVRWFYVPFGDGEDAVSPVIARATAAWQQRGRPAVVRAVVQDDDEQDHLANIYEALHGEPRVRTALVLRRLAEVLPAAYEAWNFQNLSAALDAEGVAVGKSDGQSVVRARDVSEALLRRSADLP